MACSGVLHRRLRQVGLVLLAGTAAAAQAGVLARDVRLTSVPDATEMVVELSGKASHRLFTLENPHRVVIDLADTTAQPGLRLPAASGIVEAIRTGVQPGPTLRFVLVTKSRPAARAAMAETAALAGHRLIVSIGPAAEAGRAVSRATPAAARPQAVKAAHAPADSGRDIVVAIDAGHGGADPGAIGRGGTREKDVVLAIARDLAARVAAEPGMRAVLTRNGDYYIAHRERIRRARAARADMFVSIHADSIPRRDVSGASVYVLSERGATDEAARWLAERENAADLKGGVTLDDKSDALASVLLDLSQSASLGSSMEAAARVLASLDRVAEVRKPRVQQAGFLVLKAPDIPSLLIETAYISNAGDERRLRSDEHRERLAQAIFAGIRSHFEASPPDGTRLALARRARGGAELAAHAAP